MSQTEPEVVLVTGGGNGLGAVIAASFFASGHRVGIADEDLDAAIRTARALDETERNARAIRLDVRRKSDFELARDDLLAGWGAVHVLVNNAALTAATPVMEITPDDFDEVVAVNLRGTFFGCQVFGAYFRSRGYGRIVNIASLAGQNGGTATGAHYAASKGGVLTLTKVFARELGRDGVTVNAVAPGPLNLPSVRRLLSEREIDALASTIPTGGLGDPGLVAEIVIQLSSRRAAFATGATWDLNGGLSMR